MSEIEKVPVTIITGCLGSGKSTLINWILQHQQGKNIAVIQSEFGEVEVDTLQCTVLVTEEHVSGCVCCTVRGDLIEAFKKLMEKDIKFDCVIIETSSMSDPAPICRTLFEPIVENWARLDGVITMVDSLQILDQIESKPTTVENEPIKQLVFADKIILNKIELVDEITVVNIERKLKMINRHAEIVKVSLNSGCIHLDELLGLDGFGIRRVLDMDSQFHSEEEEYDDDLDVGSVSFRFPGDISIVKLQDFLGRFVLQNGSRLYRYKGVISVRGRREKFIFQGIHMMLLRLWSEPWAEGEVRENMFCFRGRNLSREMIEKEFLDCRVGENTLRFKIGDEVQCHMEQGYVDGRVISTWDEGNAYSVVLVNGMEVWAPEDVDEYIRKKHFSSG